MHQGATNLLRSGLSGLHDTSPCSKQKKKHSGHISSSVPEHACDIFQYKTTFMGIHESSAELRASDSESTKSDSEST